MALKIPSPRSCHLVATELGEWVMYILRDLRFDLILVQLAFMYIYNFLCFFIIHRFHITINYNHVVVRYAWHSVAGLSKTWIGGRIQI